MKFTSENLLKKREEHIFSGWNHEELAQGIHEPKIIFSEDFSSGDLSLWDAHDPSASVVEIDNSYALCLDEGLGAGVEKIFDKINGICRVEIQFSYMFEDAIGASTVKFDNPSDPSYFKLGLTNAFENQKWYVFKSSAVTDGSIGSKAYFTISRGADSYISKGKVYFKDITITLYPADEVVIFNDDGWSEIYAKNPAVEYTTRDGFLTANVENAPVSMGYPDVLSIINKKYKVEGGGGIDVDVDKGIVLYNSILNITRASNTSKNRIGLSVVMSMDKSDSFNKTDSFYDNGENMIFFAGPIGNELTEVDIADFSVGVHAEGESDDNSCIIRITRTDAFLFQTSINPK